MKKVFALISLILLLFAFMIFSPFLPERFIKIESNVPLTAKEIFPRVGAVYFTFLKMKDVELNRGFLNVNVLYNEEPVCNIKFKDGTFGLTEGGFIIEETVSDGKVLICDFDSKNWSEVFRNFFLVSRKYDYLDNVTYLKNIDNGLAFFDKKDILIMMSSDDIERSFIEYVEVLKKFEDRLDNMKSIDLRYKDQAIIIWRDK